MNDKRKQLEIDKAFLEEVLFTIEYDFNTLLSELQEMFDEYHAYKGELEFVNREISKLDDKS